MLILALPAYAHVGDLIAGLDLTVSSGQPTVEATFGLVVPEGGAFAWVCHEAVTEPEVTLPPRYAQGPDGAWLAWIPDPSLGRGGATLFRSADGCTWTAVDLAGQVATGASFAPAPGAGSLPTTTSPATGGEAVVVTHLPGGIWTSPDGGATFTRAVDGRADRRFTSVAHGAGGEVWATAVDDTGGRLFLWTRTDGTWVEHELPGVGGDADVRVLAPGDPGEVFLVVDPVGGDTVLKALADGTSSVVLAPGAIVTDAAWDGERLWVVQDALFLKSLQDGVVTDHPEFPYSVGITLADGALWTAPQSYLEGALVSRSADGGSSFETVAYPDDVLAPLSCPADSDQATICEPLWDELLPRIRGFDDPPVDTGTVPDEPIPPHRDPDAEDPVEDPGGCGCTSGGPGWVGPGLLVLLGMVRRTHDRAGRGARAW